MGPVAQPAPGVRPARSGGVACRGRWPLRIAPGGPGIRRRARAAESARLEIVCGETHRGFKSHRLRHMGTDATSSPPSPRRESAASAPDGPGGPRLSDEEAMGLALEEAARAGAHGDVPVGAVALHDGRVMATGHNEREQRGDPTAHAELLVLADSRLGAGHLAAAGGHLGGDAGTLPHVCRRPGRRPGRPSGVRGGRPQGRGVRLPLQPVRRPPPQPRGGGDRRGAGRRGVRAAHGVLRGAPPLPGRGGPGRH